MTLANSTMMGSHVILLTHGFTKIIIVRMYFFILSKHDFNFGQIDCLCPVLPMIQITLNDH